MSDNAALPTRIFVGPVAEPDKYELVRMVSRGGEGEVWQAAILLDSVHVPVAIKRILPRNEDDFAVWHDRWNRQAELLRSLDHPSLVKVREVFTGPVPHEWRQGDPSTETLYLAMNWVEGPTLTEWVNRNPGRDVLESLRVIGGLAGAVDYLHAGVSTGQPLLHRDIKPSNVIITDDGVRLVDFGFVRGTSSIDPMTMVGTPDYIAPEVASGLGFSEASDRFALGATAYYAITGRVPVVDDVPSMMAALDATPGLTGKPALQDHILSMVDRDPQRRPTGAVEWAQGMAAMSIVDGTTLTPPPGQYTRTEVRQPRPEPVVAPPPPVYEGWSTETPQTEPVPVAVPAESGSKRGRGVLLALASLLLLAAAGVGAFVLLAGGDGDGDEVRTAEEALDDADDVAEEPGEEEAEPSTDETGSADEVVEPTPTPGPVDVPRVAGQPLADATAAIEAAGLVAETVTEPAAGEAGVVLDQSPAAGEAVAPGDIVMLTVSEAVPMPDLVGESIASARSQLEALGATVTVAEIYDVDAESGLVVSQSVAAGEPVAEVVELGNAVGPAGIFLEELDTVSRRDSGGTVRFDAFDLNGTRYINSIGLGVSQGGGSPSIEVEWNLGRDFDRLRGVAGYSDVSSSEHRIRLQAFGDGVKIYEADFSLGQATPIEIDLTGVLRLRLVATRISDEAGCCDFQFVAIGEAELLADPAVIERYSVQEGE